MADSDSPFPTSPPENDLHGAPCGRILSRRHGVFLYGKRFAVSHPFPYLSMTRLATTLGAAALLLSPLAAQAQTTFAATWQMSDSTGTKPSYFGANLERGFGVGTYAGTPSAIVLSRNGGNFFRQHDAATGTLLASFSGTGAGQSFDASVVTGGTFTVNDIAVTSAGSVIGCNLQTNVKTAAFKCYRWTNLAAAPTNVINFIDPTALVVGTATPRVGDTFTLSENGGTMTLWAGVSGASSISDRVYKWISTDDGVTFTPVTVTLSAPLAVISVPSVGPLPDGSFYLKGAGIGVRYYTAAGVFVSEVPTTLVPSSSSTVRYFTVNGQQFFTLYQYSPNSSILVYRATPGQTSASLVGSFKIGNSTNTNGTGDVVVSVTGETATITGMGTNNGLSRFTNVNSLTEDDVVINEAFLNPPSDPLGGREYVELLVVAATADLRGWTLSDVSTRVNTTGATEGDITLPSDGYLAAVPRGTYIVIEMATPVANASTLTEDLSLTDGTPRTLVIKPTTSGVVNGGTLDLSTNENLQLYAGSRATGTLVDQVQWGTNSSYIAGVTWGDDNGATTADNINGGVGLGSDVNLSFVPTTQNAVLGFRANDTGSVFAVQTGVSPALPANNTPGTQNTGVNDQAGALPVELSAFTAAADGQSAVLRWTTESETNNSGFAIETLRGNAWTELAFVAGRGTTSERMSYEQRIDGLGAGTHQFRLVQRDLDGTAHIAGTVEVAIGMGAAIVAEGRGASVRFGAREAGTITAEAFDVTGRRVAVLFAGSVEGGEVREAELSGVAAGVYFVRV